MAELTTTELIENENRARLSLTSLGWWRPELPKELANRYWRDIHGVGVARQAGLYQYRQLHCEAARTDVFPPIDGIDFSWSPKEQPHGISVLLFLDKAAVETLRASPLLPHMSSDNYCLVERNAGYWTEDGNAYTYVDRTGDATPQGAVAHPSFAVFFRRQESSPLEAFRTYMRDLAERWSGTGGVLRVRLQLLEGAEEGQFPVAPEHQYQAWVDLVLEDERAAKQLLSPGDGVEHASYVSAVHTLPVKGLYTIVYDGRPTLVGLRGYPAVETIEAVGAPDQKEIAVLELLYGPIVHSTSALAPTGSVTS